MLLWIPGELHVAHAIAAFVALVGAILGIWILDIFGDKLRDYGRDGSTEADNDVPLTSSSSGLLPQPIEKVRGALNRASDGVVDVGLEALQQLGLEDTESHLHVEDALRNLIKSIAVFVGLSWEKAFDVAEHTVVAHLPVMTDHRVIAKIVLALLVCAFMLPGWYWYIMPKALMDHTDHKERIELELHQEKKASHGRGHFERQATSATE